MHAPFFDIRPHLDHEVPDVLARLSDSKVLQHALLAYRFPHLPKFVRTAMTPMAGWAFKRRLQKLHTVEEVQQLVVAWVERVLKRTTSAIEVRGLENLDPHQAYLWLSNHRDIAMDPMLVNYSLHQAGWKTGHIAIGDNLLKQPEVAALMRLNKSFLVKRGISNGRERLKELKRLSGYIRQTIQTGSSVWLAQREGRAKDGIDATDTAVLKMLALAGREQQEDFARALGVLNPVPVCIQYEWDPCDRLKAQELAILASTGQYQKAPDEDTRSILLGLTGFKGRVIVSFGQPLTSAQLQTPERMAQAVDAQIQAMQCIFPVQRTALALLQQEFADFANCAGALLEKNIAQELERHLDGLEQAVRKRILQTYAQPLITAECSAAH